MRFDLESSESLFYNFCSNLEVVEVIPTKSVLLLTVAEVIVEVVPRGTKFQSTSY